jgi:hypothetical protein
MIKLPVCQKNRHQYNICDAQWSTNRYKRGWSLDYSSPHGHWDWRDQPPLRGRLEGQLELVGAVKLRVLHHTCNSFKKPPNHTNETHLDHFGQRLLYQIRTTSENFQSDEHPAQSYRHSVRYLRCSSYRIERRLGSCSAEV